MSASQKLARDIARAIAKVDQALAALAELYPEPTGAETVELSKDGRSPVAVQGKGVK